ncbi:hypothetical protein ACMYUJ_14890 [Stutzerimonas zhaodongensis]|uniref:hypothetical protein n=1 Tax=Stutzerimonas zhaodongensis TaxID=1176257 RepID=UPI0039EFBAFD
MTASISLLKDNKKDLNAANKTLKQWKASGTFGQEDEYTSNSLKAGVDATLTDLSALLRSDAKLIKETTLLERQALASATTKLSNAIVSENGSSIAAQLDVLKQLLRPYNLRASNERKEEFLEHCDELQRKATEISIKTRETEVLVLQLETAIEETESKRNELQSRINELEEAIDSLPLKLTAISKKEDLADEHVANISDAEDSAKATLSQIKESSSIIDNFAKKISQREIELEKQTEKTVSYDEHLSSYQKQHEKLLQKAESLIEKSRQTLGYATAEGLSAAFQEHHNTTKKDWAAKGWVISAGIFLILAIGIGIWVASGSSSDPSLPLIIGRITLIPLCVAGSWFSATQFIKLKNLAEDYAYKSVLAKSLIGFSEQIRQSGEDPSAHTTYLQQVLSEIHKDPLRNRNSKTEKENRESVSAKELADQLLTTSKELKETMSKLAKSIIPKSE